jgi:hypothetical protein
MARGVHYFAEEATVQTRCLPPVSGVCSYYTVLHDALAQDGLSDLERVRVEQTIEFVDRCCKEKSNLNRHTRSWLVDRLMREGAVAQNLVYLHTVVNAWNCAVQARLRPDGGSVGRLAFGVPLATYRDRPLDAMFFADDVARAWISRWREHLLGVWRFDLREVSWQTLARVVTEPRVERTRTRLQEAYRQLLASEIQPKQWTKCLKQHIREVALQVSLLLPQVRVPPPAVLYVLAPVGGAAVVGALAFGNVELPLAVAGAATGLHVASRLTGPYGSVPTVIRATKGARLTSTLMHAGRATEPQHVP